MRFLSFAMQVFILTENQLSEALQITAAFLYFIGQGKGILGRTLKRETVRI